MADGRTRRRARNELADRLIVEYAGAVPAGQVLATVLRAERLLRRFQQDDTSRLALCEELVRHRLAERTSRRGRHLAVVAS